MSSASGVQLDTRVTEFVARPRTMLINGEWVPAASGKTFATYNPATGQVLANVAEGDAEDINRAVAAARAAFDTGPWRRMTPSQRGRLIWKLGDLLEQHTQEFAELETLDNGKPLTISRAADVPLAAELFRYMAGWATKLEGSTIPLSVPYTPGAMYHAYTVREPVGVVGQIIPWNFPLLMAAWKLGPALAAGCTIVLKPAEQTPLTALRLGELMLEAGFPEGVINIVPGFGETAGAALAAHPDVDKIAFTGSTEVGRLIVHAAAGNLKKVTLELGGKSPNVVFADSNVDQAIAGAASAIFFNHGQCCCAGSRLFVEKSIFDRVAAIPFEDPAQLVARANDSVYGLAAGIWTQDVAKAHAVAAQMRAGTVWINCYNIFDAALPFGGYKQSGWGREMGHEALENYTETKAVCACVS
ncbi:MAG: aldehyde dehydrogenase family protein [Blastocatellia bacterium]|nr:aldehyde dehydrogenase family protein [Blastocatellia bacterium]